MLERLGVVTKGWLSFEVSLGVFDRCLENVDAVTPLFQCFSGQQDFISFEPLRRSQAAGFVMALSVRAPAIGPGTTNS